MYNQSEDKLMGLPLTFCSSRGDERFQRALNGNCLQIEPTCIMHTSGFVWVLFATEGKNVIIQKVELSYF